MTVEEILEALRAIVDGAEGRSLTDEEVERYEKLEVQLATVQRTEQIKQRQKAYETPVRNTAIPGPEPVDTAEKERAQAFDRYLRTGDKSIAAEYRDQTVGTGSEGGFTAPQEFRQKLVDRLKSFGGIASVAEEITTETGNTFKWPTIDDTSNEGQIVAEAGTPVAGSDMVFGEKELNAFRYMAPGPEAGGLRVSVELLQDSAFNIQELVQGKLSTRIARNQSVDWATGAGSTEPTGLTNPAATLTLTSALATGPAFGDLVDVLHSLDPEYQTNAVWVMNFRTLGFLRKLEDTNGRPLWLPQQDSGMTTTPGGTLLDKRVVIDQGMPDWDTANAKFLVYGDIRETYVIRRVRSVQLIVDPYTRAANGQVLYTVWARADGTIQNDFSSVRLAAAAA